MSRYVKELDRIQFIKKVVDITSENREWNYLGSKPCVVDFYASWCGPCKMLSPLLEEIAKEYGEKIDIYKVNSETELEISSLFGIRSIPTLLFIPLNGAPSMTQGLLGRVELVEAIDAMLE